MDVYARSTQFRYSLRAGTTLLISVTVAARSKPKTAMSRVRQLREVASFEGVTDASGSGQDLSAPPLS
jgi:hypothetical protein